MVTATAGTHVFPQANLTGAYIDRMGVGTRAVNVIDKQYDEGSVRVLLEQDNVDAVFSYTYGSCYSGESGAIR